MTNWIKVEGFPNYSVSDMGEVRNDRRGRILKPLTLSKGYQGYRLYINSKQAKTVKAHRIVAIAHIPNPDNLPQVNHDDGIKSHNWVSNLEWSTGLDNMRHAFATGLNKNEFKYQDQYDNVMILSETMSSRAIAKELGIPKSTVHYMIKKGVH